MRLVLTYIFLFLITSPVMAGETYDRMMEKQEIRCGYGMWNPVLYKDLETNQLTGITYDIMEEIGKRLDIKINWAEETGWGTLVEGIATKRYDLVCVGLGQSIARGKFIAFGKPLFYTPLIAVTKIDDTRFDESYTAINDENIKIAVLEGELSSITARQSFPDAKTISIPQISDYSMMLKEVEAGKADLTLVEPSVFKTYQENNPGQLKHVQPDNPVAVFPVSFGLPIQDIAFQHVMNVAIEELLNDGTVERILNKYDVYDAAFLPPARSYEVQ